MAKKVSSKPAMEQPAPARPAKPSSLLDTGVVYSGDNLEQLPILDDILRKSWCDLTQTLCSK